MTTKALGDDATTEAKAAGTPAACTRVRVLTPEAQRALAEAAERRQRQADQASSVKEVGGRDGPDPVRFGDWEKGGIASDF
ncbi:MAG: DUF1674 domain-containing protein [Hyphomicrobium sp.]|nr:DUF1674 domain-containing protein [Hyphomicrobium sp.]